MIERIPRGVSVRIEPGEPLAGGPYRQWQPDPGRLIIAHRWGDPELLPGPGGGVAMLVCMVLAVAIFWLEPDLNRFERAMHWFFFLSPIVMAYGSIALRWNTTTYTLDGRRLTVRHGPIPVFGNRAISKSNIASIAYRYIDNPHDDWSGGSIVVFARLRSVLSSFSNRTGSLLLRQSRADRELILRHRSRPHFCSTSRRRAPN